MPERLAARRLSSSHAAGVLRACAPVKINGVVDACELVSHGLAAGGIFSYMRLLGSRPRGLIGARLPNISADPGSDWDCCELATRLSPGTHLIVSTMHLSCVLFAVYASYIDASQ